MRGNAILFLQFIRRFTLLALLLAALGLMNTACGPIQSTQRITQSEEILERARVVNAQNYAPYEYYTAYHYLYKAKYEWGYSNYEVAIDYATRARRAAAAAILKTREDPWKGHPVPGAEDTAREASDQF